ncbi:hypothetical protein F2Q68_00014224 [Brassica cretica]|uniref:F-box domain-containing protein n=1 Tax=Brassica cretica TaxID=69181 RepID=A0A8S9HFX6_BRACR|nr:hypothetical protein F2Q68_00014224 [Brassica cretica]
MAAQVLPNLPDEIICKIIAFLGEETFYYLGDLLRSGKRGYALVHEPSVLKMCDITPMVHYVTSQICKGETRKPAKCFSCSQPINADLRSEAVLDMGESIQWLLSTSHAPWLNTYGEAFKFPDDDVIKHPKCLHGENCRNFYVGVDGSCENCKLYWICLLVCQML